MPSSQLPNILLIILHDLGTRLGCYGEAPGTSPALNQLAGEGIRFENHFCTAAFCSPSRGAIFTGKYPHTNGLMGLVGIGWDLPESSAMLGQLLAQGGYETLLFGLQHEVKDRARLGEYFHHVEAQTERNFCEDVTPHVVQFLESRAGEEDTPFYARVGFFEVHRPYDRYVREPLDSVHIPPYLADTPGAREDFAMFDGAIRATDGAVEQILGALDRSGLRDNTIVVFTTDHGIAFPRAKGTLYDPGLRTTLLLRWPAGLPGGRGVSELISNVDLLPTLLDAAAVPVPADVQGRSFLSLLRGEAYAARDEVYAEKNTLPGDLIRCVRTRRYKYIRNYHEGVKVNLPADTECSLTRRDMGDDHLAPRAIIELYDLEDDPLEFANLAGKPETASIEAKLAARLDAILEETADPILDGPIPRPPGEARVIRQIWAPSSAEDASYWAPPKGTRHPMHDLDTYLSSLEDRWTGGRNR